MATKHKKCLTLYQSCLMLYYQWNCDLTSKETVFSRNQNVHIRVCYLLLLIINDIDKLKEFRCKTFYTANIYYM